MRKRGQITLFVILGLLIISIIAVGVYYRSKILKAEGESALAEESSLPPDVRTVRNIIQECVESGAKDGLVKLGLQGGYALPIDNSVVFDGVPIAYDYDQGKSNYPTLEELKESYGLYVDNYVFNCFDPGLFPNLEIEEYEPNTVINVGENNIDVITEYKVTVKSGDASYNIFRPYKISLPVNLNHFYNAGQKIIQQLLVSPDNFDPRSLVDLGDITIAKIGEDEYVYIIKDDNSKIDDNTPFTLIFAAKFK